LSLAIDAGEFAPSGNILVNNAIPDSLPNLTSLWVDMCNMSALISSHRKLLDTIVPGKLRDLVLPFLTPEIVLYVSRCTALTALQLLGVEGEPSWLMFGALTKVVTLSVQLHPTAPPDEFRLLLPHLSSLTGLTLVDCDDSTLRQLLVNSSNGTLYSLPDRIVEFDLEESRELARSLRKAWFKDSLYPCNFTNLGNRLLEKERDEWSDETSSEEDSEE
jgi:hypothetical protein